MGIARPAGDEKLSWNQKRYLEILRRGDRDICAYCHEDLTDETRTIDHVIPSNKGGSNDLHNLALACDSCNVRKSNRDLIEFLIDLRRTRAHTAGINTSLPKPVPRKPPKAKRKPQELAPVHPWTPEHEDAKSRIFDVKRSLQNIRLNRKGFPDP